MHNWQDNVYYYYSSIENLYDTKNNLNMVFGRWHIHCRRKNRDNSRIIHTGDLYLRGWDMYKQGQGTLLRELPVMHPGGHVIKCNVSTLPTIILTRISSI